MDGNNSIVTIKTTEKPARDLQLIDFLDQLFYGLANVFGELFVLFRDSQLVQLDDFLLLSFDLLPDKDGLLQIIELSGDFLGFLLVIPEVRLTGLLL